MAEPAEQDRLEQVRRELAELDEQHGINPALPTAIVPEDVTDRRRELVEERRRLEAEA
jgi:hypothetical protein